MNYEKLLRRMRQRIFSYDGTPNESKAMRVLEKVKRAYLASPEMKAHREAMQQAHSERMLRLYA